MRFVLEPACGRTCVAVTHWCIYINIYTGLYPQSARVRLRLRIDCVECVDCIATLTITLARASLLYSNAQSLLFLNATTSLVPVHPAPRYSHRPSLMQCLDHVAVPPHVVMRHGAGGGAAEPLWADWGLQGYLTHKKHTPPRTSSCRDAPLAQARRRHSERRVCRGTGVTRE